MKKTMATLRNCIDYYKLDTPRWADIPLFFNHRGEKPTRQGIIYILQRYTEDAGIGEITPHILRHSKAVHLIETDINPVYIRDFPGHTDSKVSQAYPKASVKMKRDVIEKLAGQKTPLLETDPLVKTKSWIDDKDPMIWLNSPGH